MKKKITLSLISLSFIFLILASWIKHLTKIEDFDIFGDIEIDEEE